MLCAMTRPVPPQVKPSPMRAAGSQRSPLAALTLVALACASCNSGTAGELPPIDLQFNEQRAWTDLERQVGFGPRPAGSDAIEQTRLYLEEELRAAGLEPKRQAFVADTPAGKIPFCNVYADFEGKPFRDKRAHMVIIASHYDTKRLQQPFLGANDGGSSTACVLELARAIVAGGPRDLSYRFLFLDGEEAVRFEWSGNDNTYGSRYHADKLKLTEEYDLIKALVLLDMIGDKHLRIWRDTNSSRELLQIFQASAKERGLAKYMSGPSLAVKDDHLPFMRAGIPSIDLIDLDYGPDSKNNDWWHTVEDTIDKCSSKSLKITGDIVLGALPRLENKYRRQR
ncbi:MAG: glutaminyl-peptide cyclotransferase [Planctomycetota bacterium]|jgi:glutaminyl-peptide cyclotransferase